MRASDYIGRIAYDQAGNRLGRIADLICHQPDGSAPTIDAALVTPRHRGRMFGYQREAMRGPWLLEKLIGVLHRGTREVPLDEIVISDS
jgi:hypothetical protein